MRHMADFGRTRREMRRTWKIVEEKADRRLRSRRPGHDMTARENEARKTVTRTGVFGNGRVT